MEGIGYIMHNLKKLCFKKEIQSLATQLKFSQFDNPSSVRQVESAQHGIHQQSVGRAVHEHQQEGHERNTH